MPSATNTDVATTAGVAIVVIVIAIGATAAAAAAVCIAIVGIVDITACTVPTITIAVDIGGNGGSVATCIGSDIGIAGNIAGLVNAHVGYVADTIDVHRWQ